jgi:hypothetical protein
VFSTKIVSGDWFTLKATRSWQKQLLSQGKTDIPACYITNPGTKSDLMQLCGRRKLSE